MNRRSKTWLAVASLFNLINAAGGGYAVALGEQPHAMTHAVLLIVGGFWAWRLASTAEQRPSLNAASDERLEQLQQSVDAIALEVERISEGQRFLMKLEQEPAERVPLNPQR